MFDELNKSKKKKMIQLRNDFNDKCLERDNHECVICGKQAFVVHHITDRKDIPNDGYVIFNGASLCTQCHVKAELFFARDLPNFRNQCFELKFSPEEILKITPEYIYELIGSSEEKAFEESRKIN